MKMTSQEKYKYNYNVLKEMYFDYTNGIPWKLNTGQIIILIPYKYNNIRNTTIKDIFDFITSEYHPKYYIMQLLGILKKFCSNIKYNNIETLIFGTLVDEDNSSIIIKDNYVFVELIYKDTNDNTNIPSKHIYYLDFDSNKFGFWIEKDGDKDLIKSGDLLSVK